MKKLADFVEPRPRVLQENIILLQRKLEREKSARLAAEALLEEKSSELFDASEKLKQEAARARSLAIAVESATDGIALADKNGVFTYANPAHAKIFGYTPEEIVGQHRSILHDESEWEKFQFNALQEFKRVGQWRGDANGLKKNGQLVLINISIARLDGGGLISTTRDVSADRLLFMQTKEMEERLQKAEKQAALKTLSKSVSHDFNNLLAAISGYAMILQADLKPGSENCKRAAGIETAAAQAADVIRSLESMQENTGNNLHMIDLVAVVNTALRIVDGLTSKAIDIQLDLPNSAFIIGDDVLISRCIINVLKNAIEAIDGNGKITLRISEHRTSNFSKPPSYAALGSIEAKSQYILEIIDTGPGIVPKVLEKIFNPFYSTKLNQDGSGMGLQSLQTLAETKMAFIEAESLIGEGTRFRFNFAAPESDQLMPTERKGVIKPKGLSGAIVLVVDDDKLVGEVVSRKLEALGHKVLYYTDARDALADLHSEEIDVDVVVSDMNMPSMMGVEFTKEIKALSPSLPVIIYSGQAAFIQPDKMYADILRKPIESEHLQNAIETAILKSA